MQGLRRIEETSRHADAVEGANEFLGDMRRLAYAAANQFSLTGRGFFNSPGDSDKFFVQRLRCSRDGILLDAQASAGTLESRFG